MSCGSAQMTRSAFNLLPGHSIPIPQPWLFTFYFYGLAFNECSSVMRQLRHIEENLSITGHGKFLSLHCMWLQRDTGHWEIDGSPQTDSGPSRAPAEPLESGETAERNALFWFQGPFHRHTHTTALAERNAKRR